MNHIPRQLATLQLAILLDYAFNEPDRCLGILSNMEQLEADFVGKNSDAEQDIKDALAFIRETAQSKQGTHPPMVHERLEATVLAALSVMCDERPGLYELVPPRANAIANQIKGSDNKTLTITNFLINLQSKV